jgi:prepilin-type processing-associated H-X9-DG protein
MVSLTPLDEGILYITDEPVPNPRTVRRGRISRWILATTGVAGLVFVVVLASVGIVRHVRESRRAQCAGQLKRLGEAMQDYHEANGHFPAPSLKAEDGKALLSWRVALLPHLGYKTLYEKFRLDEPWDSPHNRALITQMPREFTCPVGPTRASGKTGYLVIVGPASDPWSVNTPFLPTRGTEIREFLDGTSNTVLVLETDTFVAWTKPDDLRWTKDGPLPRLVSRHQGGTNVLLADGSTRFLKSSLPPFLLLGLLTINGSEVLGGG